MLSILPEPKDGFSAALGNLDEYAGLFRFLGDPDTLRLFYFIGTRPQSLFSKQLAIQETGIASISIATQS